MKRDRKFTTVSVVFIALLLLAAAYLHEAWVENVNRQAGCLTCELSPARWLEVGWILSFGGAAIGILWIGILLLFKRGDQ